MARRSQIAETQPRIIVAWADDPVEVDFREWHCITSAVLQPNSDRSAGLLHLRRGDRIGAVIGGLIGAWPLVTGKPHAPELRIGRRAIGGPVPGDDDYPTIVPEAIITLRRAADERSRKTETGHSRP